MTKQKKKTSEAMTNNRKNFKGFFFFVQFYDAVMHVEILRVSMR